LIRVKEHPIPCFYVKKELRVKMRFDVVIIGSGLGGLACANILAKEGRKVCVLEKNRQFGGSLQVFSRDKTVFDTGVHYLGGLGKGENLNRFFQYFGIMDELDIKRLDENGFDRICFDGDSIEYPHAVGYQNFVDQLTVYFPAERQNLEKYVKKLKEVCDAFPLYNLEDHDEDFLVHTTEYYNTSVEDFINSITEDPLLRVVLLGNAPLYAGEQDCTPMYMHALIVNSYITSSWKCVSGGGQIARLMVKVIKELGVEIRNYCEAVKFNFSDNIIESVELKSGEKIEGDLFISNIHPSHTLDLIEPGKLRKTYVDRINNLPNSVSTFMLNVVFKKNTFKAFNHNIYYYRDKKPLLGQFDLNKDWPSLYAIFPGTGEGGFLDNISIMVYMEFDKVKKWSDTYRNIPKDSESRGEDYEQFKIERAEALLDEVEKKWPNFRAYIQSYTCSTPLTYRDYLGTKNGTLYGISRDYKDPLKSFINTKTRIPNLLLTGQNVHVHGVLGVTVGAVLTVGDIVGQEYLLNKIKAYS
jgi:all-trans-retinol 13,14-reductase